MVPVREGWRGRSLYGLALIAVVAGLTHLLTVLVLPGRSTTSAYAMLHGSLGGTTLKTLAIGSTPVAFTDPAFPNAACLYDLRKGPVSASLAVAEGIFAALSIHDRHGRVLAGLTSRATRNGRLGLTIAMSRTEPARHPNGSTQEGTLSDIRVEAADPLGFVLAEVLAAEPSEQPDAAAMAAALSCRPALP